MTDKLFDSFIKSKLESYDSGAPMHVWERIKKDDDDDPKGFFFWMWKNKYLLLSGMLLVATATGYWLKSYSKQDSTVAKSDSKNNSIITNHQVKPASPSNGLNTSTSELNNNTSQPKTINQVLLIENNTNEKPSGFQQTTGGSLNANASVSTNGIFTAERKQLKANALKAGSGKTKNQKENSADPLQDVQLPNAAEHSLSLAGNFAKPKRFPLFEFGNIALPQNKPSCPTINGPRRRELFLEVYAGPDYNVRSLTSTVAPNAYLSERENNENYRTSFSAGVRLVKNLGEKTLIKTGVNYSQINERLRIVTENSKQLTQVITIRTVVRSPGDTLFVRDTMFFEQNGTRYRTTYNRYRFIDVPLIFSYEFGNPELLHFSVNAGPVFNITSFYSGEVMDTSYKTNRISTGSGSNPYNWRNNIGIGIFTSVSMYKRFNDRIHLFAEPYMRYNLNPVTQAGSSIKQRYFITGMQLGIRYNLTPPGQRYR